MVFVKSHLKDSPQLDKTDQSGTLQSNWSFIKLLLGSLWFNISGSTRRLIYSSNATNQQLLQICSFYLWYCLLGENIQGNVDRDHGRGGGEGGGEEEVGPVGWRQWLSGPGSSPPRCKSKCGKCTPCKPVHVPVPPGTPVTTEYYPEAWRCKCGNKLYMP